MHQAEMAHHREYRQWAFLLGRLVAVTLGLVHALGLIGARARVAVFVLLLFLLGRVEVMNLSGTLVTDITGVLTALIGAVCRSRILRRSTHDHEAREGNTEHATYENLQSHCLSPVERAHCWLTSTLRNETRKPGRKSRTLAFESYLPLRTGFANGNCVR